MQKTFFLLLMTVLSGCVTSRVEELRLNDSVMTKGESVVVLARRHHIGHEAETDFTQCISSHLSRSSPNLNVYSSQQFIDELYPWFEPRTAPLDLEVLAELVEKPLIAERIEDTHVRYIVWIDGTTDSTDKNGALSCAVSPAGGGCLGFMWWDKDSSYEAIIWDLKNTLTVGKISTEASGTSYIPAFIVPLPLIARTQSSACKGLGQQLTGFMAFEEEAEQ